MKTMGAYLKEFIQVYIFYDTVLSNSGPMAAMADIYGGFRTHRCGKYRPILRVFPP